MTNKIKCLAQDEDHGLTEGAVYSVVRFDDEDVIVLNDYDEEVLLFEGEFEIVEDEEE